MKTLLETINESILSSTKSGKEFVVDALKDWVVESFNACAGSLFKIDKMHDIDVKVHKKGFSININTSWDGNWFRFSSLVKDTEKYVHEITDVMINNKSVNITYSGIDFDKNDLFAEDVKEYLRLAGGKFESISKLPKNCRKIVFDWRWNSTTDSFPVQVKEIKDIVVDEFVTSIRSAGHSSLSCMLNNIKNITVRNKMCITDGMLGHFALEKGTNMFTKETSALLDEFFKDNNVDPASVIFLPDPKQYKRNLSIYYNMDKNRWCTIDLY